MSKKKEQGKGRDGDAREGKMNERKRRGERKGRRKGRGKYLTFEEQGIK